MKYMLLVHHDEESFRKRPDSRALADDAGVCAACAAASCQRAVSRAAPLHPSFETTCVRVRDGKPKVTDGPFAETREQLGGYFLVNAKDLDEAISIAARIPGHASVPSKYDQ